MVIGRLSLWLQPEQAAADRLDALIARLAGVHDTATFASHLTVLADLEREPDDDVLTGLSQLAESLEPVRVSFGETRCEHPWRRSLYLAAVPGRALRQVFESALRTFEVPGAPAFEPHLSLQYSQLPVADKIRLAGDAGLQLPLTVRFDRLSLWHTSGSDAGRWRPIASRDLAGVAG
jgi:2'-5' RNA ligase